MKVKRETSWLFERLSTSLGITKLLWLRGCFKHWDIIINLISFTFFWRSLWCRIMAEVNTKLYTVQMMCIVPRGWTALSSNLGRGKKFFYSPNRSDRLWSSVAIPLFCMVVKLGLLYWGRFVGCWYSRIGCWERHLVLRRTRWQGVEKTTKFVIWTPHQILFGRSNQEEWGGWGM